MAQEQLDYYVVHYQETEKLSISIGIFQGGSIFHAIELAFSSWSKKYTDRKKYKAEKA